MAKANPHTTPALNIANVTDDREQANTSALTRRTLLHGSAASLVVAGAGGAIAQTAPPVDPLISLGEAWAAAQRRYEAACEQWSTIYDALPESAKGGWPIIDRSLPIFSDFPDLEQIGTMNRDRVSLSELRACNQAEQATAGDPVELAECRAVGRARVRWWIAYQRESVRLNAESGLDAADEYLDAQIDELDAVRDAIGERPAVTLAGAVVKLRVAAQAMMNDVMDGDGVVEFEAMEWSETVTLAVLADLDRIAGGAA
jgi:hypothetical protein